LALASVTYQENRFDISYEIVNPKGSADIIFLHGWGSNKNLMKQAFGDFLLRFRHVYVDLPGFGNSSCQSVLHTSDYAAIMELFLEHIGAKKEIVLGHSFGGKVALLLHPKLLVLLGSAGIPVQKSLKVRVKIMLFKMFKTFGLAKLRTYFVAEDAKGLSREMYETFKNVVDEDFSEHFRKSVSKALLCWGDTDSATPLASAQKIATLMRHATLHVYPGDHYFFLKHAPLISAQIETALNKEPES
jgi:non-heme chloroperoxidase